MNPFINPKSDNKFNPLGISSTDVRPDFSKMSDEELQAFIQSKEMQDKESTKKEPDFSKMSDEDLKKFIDSEEKEKSLGFFDRIWRSAKDNFELPWERKATENLIGVGRFARGIASGGTAGISEIIPGMDVGDSSEEKVGRLFGMAVPLSYGVKAANYLGKPLFNMAKNSKLVTNLLRAGSFGVAGATYEGVEKLAKEDELPSPKEFAENVRNFALIDLGLGLLGKGGKAAYEWLTNTSKKSGVAPVRLVNDAINQMVEEGWEVGLNERTAAKAVSTIEDIAEKGTTESKSISGRAKEVKPKFEKVAPYETGKMIQQDLAESVAQNEKVVSDLYKKARDSGAYDIPVRQAKAPSMMVDSLKEVESLRTKSKDGAFIARKLETALEDAGFQIQRDPSGGISEVVQVRTPLTGDYIKLSQILSSFVDYEIASPAARNELKLISGQLRSDARNALKVNEKAFGYLNDADKAYELVKKRFSNPTMRGITKTTKPENIAKRAMGESELKALEKTLSPEVWEKLNRERVIGLIEKAQGGKGFSWESFQKALKEPDFRKAIKEAGGGEAIGYVNTLTRLGETSEVALKNMRPKGKIDLDVEKKLFEKIFRKEAPKAAKIKDMVSYLGLNDVKSGKYILAMILGWKTVPAAIGSRIIMRYLSTPAKRKLFMQTASKVRSGKIKTEELSAAVKELSSED